MVVVELSNNPGVVEVVSNRGGDAELEAAPKEDAVVDGASFKSSEKPSCKPFSSFFTDSSSSLSLRFLQCFLHNISGDI